MKVLKFCYSALVTLLIAAILMAMSASLGVRSMSRTELWNDVPRLLLLGALLGTVVVILMTFSRFPNLKERIITTALAMFYSTVVTPIAAYAGWVLWRIWGFYFSRYF